MKNTNKLLAIILAILMIVTTVPFAFAADETPPTREIDGKTYYELDSAEDYLWFVKMCNDSVNPDEPDYVYRNDYFFEVYTYYYIPYNAILTADIVLNNNVIVDGELTADTSSLIEITPIANYYVLKEDMSGEEISYYTGTFDGNGYSISGLYINSSDEKAAMFRNVYSDGVIKNLHLKDSYVSGEWNVGGIVGGNNGTVSGCSFDGVVFATQYHAGGIVADNRGIVENCHNSAHVHSSGYQNAGIAISNSGTIRNCYNTGTIGNTTRTSQTAGIVGDNSGSIENCYNIGEILKSPAGSSVAAIASFNQPNSTITNCYFDSDTFSGKAVFMNFDGGITKNVEGKTAAEFADGTVCELVGYHVGGTATCTERAVCEICGEEYGEVDADNHNGKTVAVEAQAKTCTEIGWDAYEYCTACTYTTYVEIPALDHDIVIDDAVAPTCTETGLTEGSHCSRCEDATVAQEVVPDLGGHADENGDGKCDNGGEQLTCEDCGRPVHEGQINEYICLLISLVRRLVAFVKALGVIA